MRALSLRRTSSSTGGCRLRALVMRFLSVCSGIEAASVAWAPLGWKAWAFSEIEPFPCSVLAHHYPDVPNLGDMTKFKDWPDATLDLLCGGTPCQSYSVAGLRKGLDDPRGDLMLTYGAIAAKYRPRWLVWENVPGVLSSNGGRDFGTFLGLLGQLGYGFAYRVLDAQYFGVPQRRRRVFVVGCLGDWRAAAAVLFERHSLQGHPAPRREARQGTAVGTLRSTQGGSDVNHARAGHAIAVDYTNGLLGDDLSGTLEAAQSHMNRGHGVLAFDPTQITSATNRSNPKVGDPCRTLAKGAHAPAIAFDCKSSGQNGFGVGVEVAGTQRAMGHASSHTNGGGHQAVAYTPEVAATMVARSSRGGGQTNSPGHQADSELVARGMQVRRLTPLECERLQGFPDDYTLITHRGKPAADGPRYKALGNSWAVPCARWIGQRIAAVEALRVSMEEAA